MNIEINHPFLRLSPRIKTMIEPLASYGINYFAFMRSYCDSSRIWFTTRAEELKAYFQEKHYLHGNCEATPELYKQQVVFWSTLPNQFIYSFYRENFNIDHGITFIQPHKDYCDFFGFASTSNNPGVINHYLNNMSGLQLFIKDFQESARALIHQVQAYKIIYPSHQTPIKTYHTATPLFKVNNEKIALSKRLSECASLLITGESNKAIANQMGLSCRTVEYYVEQLKDKFSAKNKSQLIVSLLEYKDLT